MKLVILLLTLLFGGVTNATEKIPSDWKKLPGKRNTWEWVAEKTYVVKVQVSVLGERVLFRAYQKCPSGRTVEVLVWEAGNEIAISVPCGTSAFRISEQPKWLLPGLWPFPPLVEEKILGLTFKPQGTQRVSPALPFGERLQLFRMEQELKEKKVEPVRKKGDVIRTKTRGTPPARPFLISVKKVAGSSRNRPLLL